MICSDFLLLERRNFQSPDLINGTPEKTGQKKRGTHKFYVQRQPSIMWPALLLEHVPLLAGSLLAYKVYTV
jgi:hypothetical protein